jgi:predicted kinase
VTRTLVCTVGLPRAGKSSWAKRTNWPIVCPDSVRMAMHGQRYAPMAELLVWPVARLMVRALFLAGHGTVVVDATNNTRKRRNFWQPVEGMDTWDRTVFKVIPTDMQTCVERAVAMGDHAIVPIIDRMAREREELAMPFEQLYQEPRPEDVP